MSRRSYQQYCGVARALDVLGERWTLLVIRDLLLGPRRYGELAAQLPAAGTDLITARLKTLVEQGLVSRTNSGGTGGGVTYQLTDAGERLRPLIEELALIGLGWLPTPAEAVDQVDLSWALATLRIHLDPTMTPLGSCRLVDTDGDREFVLGNDRTDVTLSYGTPQMASDSALVGPGGEILAVITGYVGLADTSIAASGAAAAWVDAIVAAAPPILRGVVAAH
jgi:DNA-binding HxlR family transcriptional regulator